MYLSRGIISIPAPPFKRGGHFVAVSGNFVADGAESHLHDGCCGPAGDELCFCLDIRQKGAKLRAEKDTREENRSMAVLASIGWTTKFPDFIHDD